MDPDLCTLTLRSRRMDPNMEWLLGMVKQRV